MKGERFFFLDSNTAPTKVSQQIREKKKRLSHSLANTYVSKICVQIPLLALNPKS